LRGFRFVKISPTGYITPTTKKVVDRAQNLTVVEDPAGVLGQILGHLGQKLPQNPRVNLNLFYETTRLMVLLSPQTETKPKNTNCRKETTFSQTINLKSVCSVIGSHPNPNNGM
jgi:hypothetical protein